MKKVLVIDDDHSIRRTLELHLTQEGYAVELAADGEQGLEKVGGADIVLLDLRLPKVDGFAVLAEIKRSRPSLPVIVITAFDDMETAIQAIRLGAIDHLGKPLDLEQLEGALEKAAAMVDLSLAEVALCDTPGTGPT